jgi:hypothetical protein
MNLKHTGIIGLLILVPVAVLVMVVVISVTCASYNAAPVGSVVRWMRALLGRDYNNRISEVGEESRASPSTKTGADRDVEREGDRRSESVGQGRCSTSLAVPSRFAF